MIDPQERLDRNAAEIARYNRRLLWIAGVTAVIVVALVIVTLVKVVSIADNARASADSAVAQSRETKAQAEVIKALLARQEAQDRTRQKIVNDAVGRIAAEQRRALVAHDNSVKDFLRQALGLLEEEVNEPRNQEGQRPRRTFIGPTASGTPTAPRTAAPAPRPAPAPSPACEQAGKSGRCKR